MSSGRACVVKGGFQIGVLRLRRWLIWGMSARARGGCLALRGQSYQLDMSLYHASHQGAALISIDAHAQANGSM